MKRKYIKPATTVLMVETQNNYCTHASTWSVSDASGAVHSNADRGNVYDLTDEDERVSTYDPWDSNNW